MDAAALTFDEQRHEYWYGGRRVPGVTEILKPLVNLDAIPHDVLEAKRQLVSHVHLACQLDDESDLEESSVAENVRPYLEAWRRFLRETRAKVIGNECRVHCADMGFAGTLDRVLQLHGEAWIVDIKTAIATPLAVGPQTAAYLRAFDDPTVRRRAALRLRPDGTYRLDELTDPNDWSVFVACLTLHSFKEPK